MTKRTNVPFRNDIVGSFLRPLELKNAKEDYIKGKINLDELTKIQNKCIEELVKKEKEVGLKSVTDGEFTRSWWHLDFMWGLCGVKKKELEKGYQFKDEETRAETASLEGKVEYNENHPFFESYQFLHKIALNNDVLPRQTIPAPAQFFAELQRPDNASEVKKHYNNTNQLIEDIAIAYNKTILKFYELGCRNIQLDDCTWGMLCDKNAVKLIGLSEEEVKQTAKLYVELNNKAIANLPKDLIVTTHVCRGNYHSTYASEGGYEPIAEILFKEENVKAFYLEFDDERSGGFEPLRFVPKDKFVVLGLITSKNGILEDKEIIKKRIKEATKYIDLENLCLSPQCGFASTEEGNILTEENQWEKLKLIKEIAKEVWK